jgi:hypothetical protein
MVKVNQKVRDVLCAIYPPFIRHLSDIFSGLGTDIRHLCAIYAPFMRHLCAIYAPFMRGELY